MLLNNCAIKPWSGRTSYILYNRLYNIKMLRKCDKKVKVKKNYWTRSRHFTQYSEDQR